MGTAVATTASRASSPIARADSNLTGMQPRTVSVYAVPLSQFGYEVEKNLTGPIRVQLNARKPIMNLSFAMSGPLF